MRRLSRSFFAHDTITVARELLGKILVRKIGKKEIRTRIIETEAYIGEEDQACHARFGRTKRNSIMYGRAGHAYIYLCYGIHELLNIVTEKNGLPAAVLIRRTRTLASDRTQVSGNGPGNLTKYLKITRKLNGEDLTKSKSLWVEEAASQLACARSKNKLTIKSAERIGVAYAGKWAKKKWRFFVNLKL